MGLQEYQTHNANGDFKKDSIKLDYLDRTSREIMSRYSKRRCSFLPPELSLSPKEPRKRLSYIYETGFLNLPIADHLVKNDTKMKKFCTGSRYVGRYNQLGMSGRGSITIFFHNKHLMANYYRYLQISTWSHLRRVLQ